MENPFKGIFTKASETAQNGGDSPRPDLPATRAWVDDLLNVKLAGVMRTDGETHKHLQDQISNVRNDWYYAWFFTTKSGERVGRIMWGSKGCGYQCVGGLFSFVEGPSRGEGVCVGSIGTPTQEALEEYYNIDDQAAWDYSCGTSWWSPEDGSYLPFSKGTTMILMANLPKAAPEKRTVAVE